MVFTIIRCYKVFLGLINVFVLPPRTKSYNIETLCVAQCCTGNHLDQEETMSQNTQDLLAVYSPFQQLRVMNSSTKNKSRGPWVVTMDQLGSWQGFETEVKARTRTVLPAISNNAPIGREDTVKVAGEAGVVARFNEHVGQPVSRALETLAVPRVFSEYPKGDNANKCAGPKEPDFTIQDHQEQVRVVGEAKTPWTTSLSLQMSGSDDCHDTCRVLG